MVLFKQSSKQFLKSVVVGNCFRNISLSMGVCFVAGFFTSSSAIAGELPKFFTYLKAVDPSIIQEMRYYGSHNFLGRPVEGYKAAECILTLPAAKALKKVQARLKPKGLSLKVYDCYRPQRAVNDFVAWSKKPRDTKTKAEFYPTLKKSKLFGLGYIARRSSHSRGSTVDLSIVPLPPKAQPRHDMQSQAACYGPVQKRFADNSLDFGTGYDCFHEKSHTRSNVGVIANKNRELLVREMAAVGFENYRKEWWHFSLKNEPYRRKHFDFPITPFTGEVGASRLTTAKKKTDQSLDREGARVATGDEAPLKKVETAWKEETTLRVVCVAENDVLNVREAAHHKAKIVAALPSDAVGIVIQECRGEISLKAWHGLESIGRKTYAAPWCRISTYKLSLDDEVIQALGWVSGAFLAGDYTHRVCLK